MKIAHLEEFATLATSLSFSKTAKQHHISTSVLSKHISTLEKEAGRQLLVRSTTSVRLTPEGRRFYEGLQPVVESYRTFIEEFGRAKLQEKKHLVINIGVRTASVMHAAAEAGAMLLQESGIKVDYATPVRNSYYDSLNENGADAVITYKTGKIPKESIVTPLARDPFVAILPIDHPVAEKDSISLERDISQHRMVRLKGSYFQPGQDTIMEACEQHNVEPLCTYSLAETFDDLALFSNLSDILIVPSEAVPHLHLVSPLTHKILPFEEDLAFEIAIVYPPENQSQPLLDYVKKIKEAMR